MDDGQVGAADDDAVVLGDHRRGCSPSGSEISPMVSPAPPARRWRARERSMPPSGARSQVLVATHRRGLPRSRTASAPIMPSDLHHPQAAEHRRLHRRLVEAQRLAALEEQHLHAALAAALAQRAFAQLRDRITGGPKASRESQELRLAGRDADLRQVGAVQRGGMHVDAVLRTRSRPRA